MIVNNPHNTSTTKKTKVEKKNNVDPVVSDVQNLETTENNGTVINGDYVENNYNSIF